MKIRSIFSLMAIVLVISLLAGTVSAAKVTLSDGKVNGSGEQTTIHLVLDEAPGGLSGYSLNLTFDLSVAKISKVDFPAWAVLKTVNGIGEGNDIRLTAVDLRKSVQSGAKNIELATITLEGQNKGSTNIHIYRDRFDDDADNSITRSLTDGSFTVGDVPVATKLPATPTPQSQGTLPVNPTTASAGSKTTSKVTYSAPSSVVPVFGIILSIIILSAGGYLRRM